MSDVVIRVENLSKEYRLGTIGSNTLRADVSRWWAKWQGQPDPTRKVGQAEHSNRNGEQIWALQDINFEVKQGEVLGIIGRNGAGKSTLLKILSRVTSPTTGNVKVKGRIASLLEVGTGFHPELTGRENIYLNGAILGMRKYEIDRKFDEIVDFSGVEQFIDTPVKRYSSGMYVRLAFAVAAYLDPEILVVDEVLAVGDAEFQKKCLGKMGGVAKEGRTVLFVSHNMAAVERLCSRTILLKGGEIAMAGKTEEAITAYLELISIRINGRPVRSQFAEIEIKTQSLSNNVTDTFRIGEHVKFVVALSVDTPIDNAAIGIGIEDSLGNRIVTLHTMFQHASVWSIKKSMNIIVDWPECILLPGVYRLISALYENEQLVAAWENIGELRVLDTDYFGTGKLPDPRHQGKIAVKAKWHFEDYFKNAF